MTATTAPAKVYPISDFEITNTCQCYTCAECSLGFHGSDDSPCDECGGEVEPSADCFDCYSDDRAIIKETAEAWFATNPAPEGIYIIEGQGMGWRGRAGVKAITSETDIVQAIAVDSEWVQTWSIDPEAGGAFTATQSHHDSMGEAYSVRASTEAEAEEWRYSL